MEGKAEVLASLVTKRRNASSAGYRLLGDFHGGAYECQYVSPYTKSACNLDADVFLLLQDWASEERLLEPFNPVLAERGQLPELPTNLNVTRYLQRYLGIQLRHTYATNLFPFVKKGRMSSAIPFAALVSAAADYALPQIMAIRPRLVICFGASTMRALQKALGRPVAKTLGEAIATPFQMEGATVWCQSHPGGIGRANRNRSGVDRVGADWTAMALAFRDRLQGPR